MTAERVAGIRWLPILFAGMIIVTLGLSVAVLWVAPPRTAPVAVDRQSAADRDGEASTVISPRRDLQNSPLAADSREEKWLQALADDGRDDLTRLDALLDAYRYPRKLTDEQLAPIIDPRRPSRVLRSLAADLAAAGYAVEVVKRFDRRVLLEVDDPDLVMQIALQTAEVHGTEAAVDAIESVKTYLSRSSQKSSRLDSVHRNLTIRLLDESSRRGDWALVAQRLPAAHTAFPNDPHLLLFEIRLAIANGDWRGAEHLLMGYAPPQSLADEVAALQSRIDRLKGAEGKIVVRFRPGSRHIRVTALLNGTLSQAFLIDTGASMVTIPRATARRLGVSLDNRAPVRSVYTAGGPVKAREVTLAEIALDGWAVQQVDALVLDIPERSDLGLLGLNFLQRFDVDLQAEKGMLTLTPR